MNEFIFPNTPAGPWHDLFTFEDEYLDLLDDILQNGEHRADRTGTGTTAVFGRQLEIDLNQGFPAVTTKKLAWKSMVAELLWFVEGSGDERRLAEIQHGTRDESKTTIWSGNATAPYWTPKAKYPGDLGEVYGVQWRHWKDISLMGGSPDSLSSDDGMVLFNTTVLMREVDQLKQVIKSLKTNPTDRRIILTAWNPGALGRMALPPCHMFAQFYLSNDNKLSCQMYQRSVDSFLGLPFNIASYALLTHMIAHVIKADVGRLIMVLGDTHIYNDHIEQVKVQLDREPLKLPKLVINREVTDIDDFKMEDFTLEGYESHPAITARMSV